MLGCRPTAFMDTMEVERVKAVAQSEGEGESLIIFYSSRCLAGSLPTCESPLVDV